MSLARGKGEEVFSDFTFLYTVWFYCVDLLIQPRDINIAFENLDGQVPLNSPFYVERPPIEASCYTAIVKPGALVG